MEDKKPIKEAIPKLKGKSKGKVKKSKKSLNNPSIKKEKKEKKDIKEKIPLKH